MKAEYQRDLNRKYLVITGELDEFQTEMLLRNRSEGFVMLKREDWDNETKLYYDITGKQSLEKGFMKRKITYRDMSDLLYSISSQVKECKRLFLDVSGLVLSPEFIYRDLSTEKYYWIFNPGERDPHELLELAEYLLEHIDNGNQSVVRTTYELYRRAKEGSIDAENLYEILQGCEEEEPEYEESPKEIKPEPLKEEEARETKSLINRNKKKVEQTIDKLFLLMKKRDTESEPVKEPLFNHEELLHERDLDDDGWTGSETVFISLPEGDARRLISRDGKIPDADLGDFPCILGSKADCVDIFLNDRSVSRMHAQIDEAAGKLYIYDLNSKNGTFINGQKLVSGEKEIKQGDEIRLGNLRFVLA